MGAATGDRLAYFNPEDVLQGPDLSRGRAKRQEATRTAADTGPKGHYR